MEKETGMEREKLEELVQDLKSIRNAVYEITNASNPYERTVWTKHACEVAHNVTEKYKKLLREGK